MLKQKYLKIESDEPVKIHHIDYFNKFEFDDTTNYAQAEDTSSNNKLNNFNTCTSQTKRNKSIFYQIKIEKDFMKCPRFYFYCGEKLLFSAKQKIHQVFIAEGRDIHINDKKTKKIAIITQNSDGYNILNVNDQVIKINYLRTSPSQFKKLFSLRLSFMNCDDLVYWSPKILRRSEQLCGQYNRKPIKSKKNILLQNKSRHTTFIVRKMDKELYEAECNSTLSPIIAFSIAISEIIGPFLV